MLSAPTQENILREYPRLTPDGRFTFRCGRDLDCFTHCCRDVSIVLTPFDVLRMKKAVGMNSSGFLEKYTISPFTPDQRIPAVLIKMDPETRKCPFVTERGCGIYADRPWACRMYPLGVAQPQNPTPTDRAFHFLLNEEICHGHGQGQERTVRDWIAEQGIEEYEVMNASFKELMLDEFWDKQEALTPEKMEMYYQACYDLDRFRRFVFETRFLELFDVDEARVEALRSDDLELLDFAMQWLRFSLMQQRTMKIKRSVVKARAQGALDGVKARAQGALDGVKARAQGALDGVEARRATAPAGEGSRPSARPGTGQAGQSASQSAGGPVRSSRKE